jgi:MFS family permease
MTRFFQQLGRFFRHRLFTSFYLPSLLFAIAIGLRIPILPLYALSLTETYFLVGLVVAGAGLGTLIADLPAGYLLRGRDKRLGMMLGIGIEALCTLGLLWARSVWLVLGLRILAGFGLSLYGVARHAYISEAVRLAVRGRALSLFGGLMRVGLFIGPAIGGLLGARFGIRFPFVVYFFICCLAVLVLFLDRNHSAGETLSDQPAGEARVGLRGALRGRLGVFVSASLAHVLAQITRAGQRLILPLYEIGRASCRERV